jgi:hypothetical protein
VQSSQEVEVVQRVRFGIEEVLDGPARQLVSAYYAPGTRSYGRQSDVLFAGRYFDELPDNEPDAFTAGDLAAASLLDVRFGPNAA